MTLWEMSVSGGILILVILAARRLFQNRLPGSTFLILWMAALLRLLVPWYVEAPFSVYTLWESSGIADGFEKAAGSLTSKDRSVSDSGERDGGFSGQEAENGMGNSFREGTESAAGETENGTVSGELLCFRGAAGLSLPKLLWLSGGLICAGFYLTAYLKYRRLFRVSLPAEDPAVREWLKSVTMKRKLQVRSLDLIATPMTYGVLRPVILLPKGIQWEDARQMKFVLTHELIHIRRFDAVWKFMLVAAVCIHWFNPLVWLMQILANRDLELACDEKVVEQFGQDARRAYAMSLISLAGHDDSRISWGSGFSKDAMEERIAAIMKKKRFTVGSFAGAGILVMFVAVLFAASLLQKTAGENVGAAEEEKDNRILTETEEIKEGSRILAQTEPAAADKVPDLEQFSHSDGMVLLPLPKKNPTDLSEGIDSETVWEGEPREKEPFVLFLKNISRSPEFPEYEDYGLVYDEENAHFLYEGEIVGYFKDEMGPNQFRRFTDEEGAVEIVVERDKSWNMTGFAVNRMEEKQ